MEDLQSAWDGLKQKIEYFKESYKSQYSDIQTYKGVRQKALKSTKVRVSFSRAYSEIS